MGFLSAAVILFLVMDPVGNIPVFLSALKHIEPRRRPWIVVREMLIALGILLVFLFFGRYLLSALQITEPALSIAGGVVLFLIALRMVFPPSREPSEAGEQVEPFIVPLAVPLVAGPSAMATVILFSRQSPDKMGTWFPALLLAWFASAVVLVSAEILRKRVGTRLINALERLMGMILITLAVQMLLSGIQDYAAVLRG